MNKQELKLVARVLENIPHMSSDVMQGWIDNPKALKRFLSGLVPEERSKPYLRHLKNVTLASTKGDVTLAKAKDVFTGWLDSDFSRWGTDISGEDTVKTIVGVHEGSRNGPLWMLFKTLGDLHKRALSQGQIVEFCHNHRDLLRQRTFFLFKVNDELFVANVRMDDGGLKAAACRFGFTRVWHAGGYQLVVKQQVI